MRSCTSADLSREDDAVAGEAEPLRLGGRQNADWTIASRITAPPFGAALAAFSSISLVKSAWSSEPQLTPIRTGLP